MGNSSTLDASDEQLNQSTRLDGDANPRLYYSRLCPSCGATIFGMPGGRDAHCPTCGYKDPCCSD